MVIIFKILLIIFISFPVSSKSALVKGKKNTFESSLHLRVGGSALFASASSDMLKSDPQNLKYFNSELTDSIYFLNRKSESYGMYLQGNFVEIGDYFTDSGEYWIESLNLGSGQGSSAFPFLQVDKSNGKIDYDKLYKRQDDSIKPFYKIEESSETMYDSLYFPELSTFDNQIAKGLNVIRQISAGDDVSNYGLIKVPSLPAGDFSQTSPDHDGLCNLSNQCYYQGKNDQYFYLLNSSNSNASSSETLYYNNYNINQGIIAAHSAISTAKVLRDSSGNSGRFEFKDSAIELNFKEEGGRYKFTFAGSDKIEKDLGIISYSSVSAKALLDNPDKIGRELRPIMEIVQNQQYIGVDEDGDGLALGANDFYLLLNRKLGGNSYFQSYYYGLDGSAQTDNGSSYDSFTFDLMPSLQLYAFIVAEQREIRGLTQGQFFDPANAITDSYALFLFMNESEREDKISNYQEMKELWFNNFFRGSEQVTEIDKSMGPDSFIPERYIIKGQALATENVFSSVIKEFNEWYYSDFGSSVNGYLAFDFNQWPTEMINQSDLVMVNNYKEVMEDPNVRDELYLLHFAMDTESDLIDYQDYDKMAMENYVSNVEVTYEDLESEANALSSNAGTFDVYIGADFFYGDKKKIFSSFSVGTSTMISSGADIGLYGNTFDIISRNGYSFNLAGDVKMTLYGVFGIANLFNSSYMNLKTGGDSLNGIEVGVGSSFLFDLKVPLSVYVDFTVPIYMNSIGLKSEVFANNINVPNDFYIVSGQGFAASSKLILPKLAVGIQLGF